MGLLLLWLCLPCQRDSASPHSLLLVLHHESSTTHQVSVDWWCQQGEGMGTREGRHGASTAQTICRAEALDLHSQRQSLQVDQAAHQKSCEVLELRMTRAQQQSLQFVQLKLLGRQCDSQGAQVGLRTHPYNKQHKNWRRQCSSIGR